MWTTSLASKYYRWGSNPTFSMSYICLPTNITGYPQYTWYVSYSKRVNSSNGIDCIHYLRDTKQSASEEDDSKVVADANFLHLGDCSSLSGCCTKPPGLTRLAISVSNAWDWLLSRNLNTTQLVVSQRRNGHSCCVATRDIPMFIYCGLSALLRHQLHGWRTGTECMAVVCISHQPSILPCEVMLTKNDI